MNCPHLYPTDPTCPNCCLERHRALTAFMAAFVASGQNQNYEPDLDAFVSDASRVADALLARWQTRMNSLNDEANLIDPQPPNHDPSVYFPELRPDAPSLPSCRTCGGFPVVRRWPDGLYYVACTCWHNLSPPPGFDSIEAATNAWMATQSSSPHTPALDLKPSLPDNDLSGSVPGPPHTAQTSQAQVSCPQARPGLKHEVDRD